MLLRDSLDDAVADVSADLHTLATASRRRGLAIRRRRRTLAAVGTVAAVTVLAAGSYVLQPGADGGETPVAVDPARPLPDAPLSGATAPITDGGVAAALAAAVDEVADGTTDRFQGDVSERDAMAALLFRPAGGRGPAGQVFVNLQPAAAAGARPYTCEDYLAGELTDCAVQDLPGGATLRTYRQDDDTELGAGSQRVVAEVVRPAQRLRVVVFATNTNPWTGGELRDAPVLSTGQLTEIASQPWWSRTRLPVEHVRAGETIRLH